MWSVFLITEITPPNCFFANFKGYLIQHILLYTVNSLKIDFSSKKVPDSD